MRRLAIIPARSGSKGLKDKNIIDVCGKPLIAYTIEAAIFSGLFQRIIVSTDSKKYGQIASDFGAEVLIREKRLADDYATSFMVIEDVLKRVEGEYDYFALLQPTSPLRNSKHIKAAVELFEKRYDAFDFLVSMCEANHPKALINPIDEEGTLKYFDMDFSNYRRQQFKEYYPNGAIFLGKGNRYLEKKHFFGERSMAYVMDRSDSVDIDTELDYRVMCYLIEKMSHREV